MTKNVAQSKLPDSAIHVIDGGALLHWVQKIVKKVNCTLYLYFWNIRTGIKDFLNNRVMEASAVYENPMKIPSSTFYKITVFHQGFRMED